MTRLVVGMAFAAALVVAPALVRAEGDPRVKATRGREQAAISLHGRQRSNGHAEADPQGLRPAVGRRTATCCASPAISPATSRCNAARRATRSRCAPAASRISARSCRSLRSPPALRSFDALMRTPWGRSARAAEVFRSAHALLASLRGNDQPTLVLTAMAARPVASLVPVRRDSPQRLLERLHARCGAVHLRPRVVCRRSSRQLLSLPSGVVCATNTTSRPVLRSCGCWTVAACSEDADSDASRGRATHMPGASGRPRGEAGCGRRSTDNEARR